MTMNEAGIGQRVSHTFAIGDGGWGNGTIVDVCEGDDRVVRVEFDVVAGPPVKTIHLVSLVPIQ